MWRAAVTVWSFAFGTFGSLIERGLTPATVAALYAGAADESLRVEITP